MAAPAHPCATRDLLTERYRTADFLRTFARMNTDTRMDGEARIAANAAADAVGASDGADPVETFRSCALAFLGAYLARRPEHGALIDLIMLEAGPGR
jgi:hypothetical protein